MLTLWMAYAMAVSALVLGGAALTDRALRRSRRLLWGGAVCASVLIPLVGLVAPRLLAGRGGVTVLFGAIEPIVNAPLGALGGALPPDRAVSLDVALGVVWAVASLGLLLVLAFGAWRLGRAARRWSARSLDGHRVLLSDGVGPAVLGVRNPEIVIPPWVLELDDEDRRLILTHEAEHRAGRDPALLAAGLLALVAQPWNLPLWWGFHRLRDAVETDCDARVLARTRSGLQSYARLLLDVGARPGSAVPLGAGFGERVTTIERRIRAMLGLDRKRGWRGVLVRSAIAAVLVVAACSLEVNINTGESADQEAATTDAVPPAPTKVPAPAPPETPVVRHDEADRLPPPPPQERGDISAAPTFTPFTVAPSIVNRREVVEAMEREYPPLLRDAGIGGTVRVYFFIDVEGTVQKVLIDQSSGHEALDDAARRVAGVYRFTPALNRDERVPVWVSFPITFQVR
jgi:TonB family protein